MILALHDPPRIQFYTPDPAVNIICDRQKIQIDLLIRTVRARLSIINKQPGISDAKPLCPLDLF